MDDLKCNVIVLDTLSYAGNFERELCAYVTGQSGDCHVGEIIAEESAPQITHLKWWINNIEQIDDGEECFRPCQIWKTENRAKGEFEYCSVAIFVKKTPPQEVLDEMLIRAKFFCADPVKAMDDLELYPVHNVNSDLKLTGYRLITPNIEEILVKKEIVSSVNTVKFKF